MHCGRKRAVHRDVRRVPTLSLLNDVAFDNDTEAWSFSYETMAVDGSVPGQVNRYYRVLYLTRAGHDVGTSNTGNPCLEAGAAYADCLRALRSDCVVLEDAAHAPDESERDRLETSTWVCGECPGAAASVNMTLEPRALSATQTMRLRITDAVMRIVTGRAHTIHSARRGSIKVCRVCVYQGVCVY